MPISLNVFGFPAFASRARQKKSETILQIPCEIIRLPTCAFWITGLSLHGVSSTRRQCEVQNGPHFKQIVNCQARASTIRKPVRRFNGRQAPPLFTKGHDECLRSRTSGRFTRDRRGQFGSRQSAPISPLSLGGRLQRERTN